MGMDMRMVTWVQVMGMGHHGYMHTGMLIGANEAEFHGWEANECAGSGRRSHSSGDIGSA